MIFLAVGTQLPFDRLVYCVDEWAAEAGRKDVVGQIGPSDYAPRAMQCFQFMDPATFTDHVRAAELLIAHAGMGSILGALELAKPIIIMPRSAAAGEHRNEHQLATAKRFDGRPGIYVAYDEMDLRRLLGNAAQLTGGRGAISNAAPAPLQTAIRDFIEAA